MKLLEKLISFFITKPALPEQPAPVPEQRRREQFAVTDEAVGMAEDGKPKKTNPFTIPKPYPNVVPAGKTVVAQDSAAGSLMSFAAMNTAFDEGVMAFSYAYLAELSQRAEYRRACEIIAKEMTRKWIRLQSTGDEDKTDKLKAIEKEMKRLGVKSAFRQAFEMDGYFGRAQIYMDFAGFKDDPEELKVPLYLNPQKIMRGSLKKLQVIEPLWTYPNEYNSTDPLNDTYYKPQSWYVMGRSIHATRLLTIISRPVPDILKPAYQFGGLSLSQMMKPYVDNWLRTRQSVSDLVHSFSVPVLKTQMGSELNRGAMENLRKRIQIFNRHRDNRGTFVVDKDAEDFTNVSTPLSTLDSLQAQSQEQMSSVAGVPLSILLGITPTGLNASTDGEVRTFYQWVEAEQEAILTPPMNYLLTAIQLSLFGEIDPEITFKWEPLWALSEKEQAEVRKMDAETDVVLIDAGVLAPEESRKRLASEEDSPYNGLEVDKMPVQPVDELDSLLMGSKPGEPGESDQPAQLDDFLQRGANEEEPERKDIGRSAA